MANLLDRFNKNVIGSKGYIFDYTSVIISTGDFKRLSDLDVILNSWTNILLTPTRTYDHDPEYGCDLYKMVFEPADDITMEKIKHEIETKLYTYDDRATISEIDVVSLNNKKGFNVNIKVEYNEIEGELEVIIDESLYFKFMEVVD